MCHPGRPRPHGEGHWASTGSSASMITVTLGGFALMFAVFLVVILAAACTTAVLRLLGIS